MRVIGYTFGQSSRCAHFGSQLAQPGTWAEFQTNNLNATFSKTFGIFAGGLLYEENAGRIILTEYNRHQVNHPRFFALLCLPCGGRCLTVVWPRMARRWRCTPHALLGQSVPPRRRPFGLQRDAT